MTTNKGKKKALGLGTNCQVGNKIIHGCICFDQFINKNYFNQF